MKALKITLGVLVALAAIYFTLAFIGPAHVRVEREALIEAPVDIVFSEVNSLNKWSAWDPWQAMDTNMVNTYSGPETGVGNKNTWTSEVMGNGSQELTESIENSRIASHLSMEWMGESDASFTFTPEGKTTRVKWVMDKDITFFGRPFMVFMDMDEMLGKDLRKDLPISMRIVRPCWLPIRLSRPRSWSWFLLACWALQIRPLLMHGRPISTQRLLH